MIRGSANYTYTHHNFVIQNAGSRVGDHPLAPVFAVVHNLLNRGKPTHLSPYLQGELGPVHEDSDFKKPLVLVSSEPSKWRARIKGGDAGNNPARVFFDELLPEALGDRAWVRNLIYPEAPIDEITGGVGSKLAGGQVDFYLPQARLVIEVDGPQHKIAEQAARDRYRDRIFDERGIRTVRIWTSSIAERGADLRSKLAEIVDAVDGSGLVSLYEPGLDTGISRGSAAYRKKVLPCAVMRAEMLLLELLWCGRLGVDQDVWNLSVVCSEAQGFIELAAQDLLEWLSDVLGIMGQPLASLPEVRCNYVGRLVARNADEVQIDFSIFKRWTDAADFEPTVTFVRADYIDLFAVEGGGRIPADHFRLETADPVHYEITDDRRGHLKRLLRMLFGHESFLGGQLAIIESVLSRRPTLGVLPTAGGKSLCYQIAMLLQPGPTLVVAPIISLMRDQLEEMSQIGITRVARISSDMEPEEKARNAADFASGRTFGLLVSPERLQTSDFRDRVETMRLRNPIMHVVVDEVHCLSEWGHSFRTSYLNLARTIDRFTGTGLVVGLTATASANVLKDIRLEFGLREEDVQYKLDYTRPELEFKVEHHPRSNDQKWKKLTDVLEEQGWSAWAEREQKRVDNSGIIFTPHVNGKLGCHYLAGKLTARFEATVGAFSGARPKPKAENDESVGRPGAQLEDDADSKFEEKKKKTQDWFKANPSAVICATKAFGMGINKKDVRWTVHYGIPSSMEALYQEAGRAGRDKEKATCWVLASEPDNESERWIFDRNVLAGVFRELAEKKGPEADLRTQAYLLSTQFSSIAEDFRLLGELLEFLSREGSGSVLVERRLLPSKWSSKSVEKAIYRLSQLGYVEDWIVTDFFEGHYRVEFRSPVPEEVERYLVATIQKYDTEIGGLADVWGGDSHETYDVLFRGQRSEQDRLLLTLLQWSYDHFVYARRQSLKTVSEKCYKFRPEQADEFRRSLEEYFRIDASAVGLQDLAEKGAGSADDWAGVLLDPETQALRSAEQLASIRARLSRLLESYESSSGLNVISGLLRLALAEYEDLDGSERLVRGLRMLRQRSPDNQDAALASVLRVGAKLAAPGRERLAQDLMEAVGGWTSSQVRQMHDVLGDSYSHRALLAQFGSDLATATGRISDGLSDGGPDSSAS